MQTSCPECRTTFRVSQEQLGLRRGLVRCGHCNAVFNAYDTLLPELEEPPVAAREPVLDALSDSTSLPELALPEWLDRIPPPAPEPTEARAEDTVSGRLFPDAPETPEVPPDLVDAEPEPETAPAAESPESILLSELPNRRPPAPPAHSVWKRASYGLASLLLALLLVAQAALFLRADLAAALPSSRPALEFLCAPFGCAVPLPRQLTKQAIAASNLEHDTEQKSRVRLTFLLANRTGQTQTWPALLLTLTDVREAPVAQKLFPPERYLPKDTRIAAGMPDGSEKEVRLDLDIGNLAATGYALSLVYP